MRQKLFFLFIVISMLLWTYAPAFSWTDGQDASYVIGQADFVSNSSGTSATGFNFPNDVAIDVANGKLYVVDILNSRVLRFAYPITGNQPAAELVFGQPDFVSSGSGTTQNTLYEPSGAAVDDTGRLWVADKVNNRVLYFNNAYAIAANQPNADGVLGQSNFTSNSAATTQNRMYRPFDMVVSSDGSLYVVDTYNNRVLCFDDAVNKANGANADAVLGQPDFVSNGTALTQAGMNTPRGVALYNDTLFVTDRNNGRVLRFDNVSAKTNGANADGVLGQPDFTTNVTNAAQNGMEVPGRVVVDDQYCRLFVSDGYNFDRILVFNGPTEKENGGDADNVLGQSDFTTVGSGLAQNRLNMDSSGGGMGWDPVNDCLVVSDDNNNRVLVFTDASPTPSCPDPTTSSSNGGGSSGNGGCFINTSNPFDRKKH